MSLRWGIILVIFESFNANCKGSFSPFLRIRLNASDYQHSMCIRCVPRFLPSCFQINIRNPDHWSSTPVMCLPLVSIQLFVLDCCCFTPTPFFESCFKRKVSYDTGANDVFPLRTTLYTRAKAASTIRWVFCDHRPIWLQMWNVHIKFLAMENNARIPIRFRAEWFTCTFLGSVFTMFGFMFWFGFVVMFIYA